MVNTLTVEDPGAVLLRGLVRGELDTQPRCFGGRGVVFGGGLLGELGRVVLAGGAESSALRRAVRSSLRSAVACCAA
ncbi:hypothetical protein [Streptomyces fodineus]|uniref:hypothetical protein n=1 Tax=Streptomyces fodineus TaxID=1904616 RepID=UPI00131D9AA6|nr:hypothetical protein [Streptomyces fodineus]